MDSQVQEIKDKVSINDVVGQYVKLERAGRNWRARCPFHKERTPSFMVSPERGSYICFGCGEKGDIFTFVEKIEHVDFKTALQQLANKAGVVLKNTYTPKAEDKQKEEQLRDVCEEATKFFEGELKKREDVLKYLKGRGVKDETIASWRVGYAPAHWRDLSEHLAGKGYGKELIVEAGLGVRSQNRPDELYDRFRGRIMFPLFDAGGKVIAFSGRFFEKVEGSKDEGEPAKYVNSPETPIFKKSRVLYGYDRAKNFIRKADCVLLVEGQFDVIMSHQSGLPFTVASSGTAITEEQLSLISRLSKRLVLALDADSAGIRAGLKTALMAISMGFDVKVPTFSAKDPADLAKEDPELLKQAIRSSKTAVEYFMDVLALNAKDERSYKKLVEGQILPLVAALPSKIEQAHFARIIAARLRVPEDAIYAEVGKRPKTAALSEEPANGASVAPDAPPRPSSLEYSAALLLFYFADDQAMQAKVEKLIGPGRVQEIQDLYQPQAEKLRFKFEDEEHGSDVQATAQKLLKSLEQKVVEERMMKIREELSSAPREKEAELSRELGVLTKRREELKN